VGAGLQHAGWRPVTREGERKKPYNERILLKRGGIAGIVHNGIYSCVLCLGIQFLYSSQRINGETTRSSRKHNLGENPISLGRCGATKVFHQGSLNEWMPCRKTQRSTTSPLNFLTKKWPFCSFAEKGKKEDLRGGLGRGEGRNLSQLRRLQSANSSSHLNKGLPSPLTSGRGGGSKKK